ncbi:uncharacterized protein LOC126827031 [Patella vulgata]|uniref:uncharacterized protein LOC126827031 n=1 Tax=Patella vulgata TaxID=6465 RepID=UPI00218067F4|nr:uncharacterized protein LOC126827031 [Patella vulgata]
MDYEIIQDVRKCQRVIETLMKEEIISCDAEGINLGKDGPLTLLQIATTDGHVYLFDIHKEKRMFQDGGLKQLLESNHVLKVFHACSSDSQALEYQFGVSLKNVFDTQVAHLVILEQQGRLIPQMLKLSKICEIYGTTKMEEKTGMHKKWNKVFDYWEIRPLTEEMIEYACADVRVLVPGIYENQIRMLKDMNAMKIFSERVDEMANYLRDPNLQKTRKERMANGRKAVLRNMCLKYQTYVSSETLIDEDEKAALGTTWTEKEIDLYMNPFVQYMYYEGFVNGLKELQSEMDRDGDDFNANVRDYIKLCKAKLYPKPMLKMLANDLCTRFRQFIFNDMVNKYNKQTPLYYLGSLEKVLLKEIRINSSKDKSRYHSVLVDLHFKLTEDCIKQFHQTFIEIPSKVIVTKGYYSFLSCQTKRSFVPVNVCKAATQLKQAIDKAGKGPVQKKNSRSTGRPPSGQN